MNPRIALILLRLALLTYLFVVVAVIGTTVSFYFGKVSALALKIVIVGGFISTVFVHKMILFWNFGRPGPEDIDIESHPYPVYVVPVDIDYRHPPPKYDDIVSDKTYLI